eukprot:CAMPEP_0206038374 /NCGR_PEP_ID=MMETSP1466-20131121/4070_1 /ASSEMBLY_ACC=CAM_ASM_001126 /TAXON_ID=44452 /ORGANISM="Pavlova gyrans, Strain CCMP608" /LENGTH=67 /DNA_ID=CAMNT_0053412969 /DNA_START=380 /DNA_END=581 /DNA_ORIENTATION=+
MACVGKRGYCQQLACDDDDAQPAGGEPGPGRVVTAGVSASGSLASREGEEGRMSYYEGQDTRMSAAA